MVMAGIHRFVTLQSALCHTDKEVGVRGAEATLGVSGGLVSQQGTEIKGVWVFWEQGAGMLPWFGSGYYENSSLRRSRRSSGGKTTGSLVHSSMKCYSVSVC